MAMHDLFFEALVTYAGRGLILRDRLRGVPRKNAGEEQPGTATRFWIPSGPNFLDALLVEPVGRVPRASVLICHGIGETVEHWRAAQGLLAKNGVCSLVFNYSGYGRSSGRVDWAQWERDAVEAFCFLRRRMGGVGVSVLGYSLGSGVATAIVGRVPTGQLILCAGFDSLRGAARRAGLPTFLARHLPDIWDNKEALRRTQVPVSIVHGAEDRLFPPSIARELAEGCRAPCELVVVSGVSHNGPLIKPDMDFWGPVIERLSVD